MSDYSDVVVGVQATIASYARALDAGHTEDIVALFTPDAVVEITGQVTFEGHQAIRETYASWMPTAPQRHVVANVVVTSWTDDHATAVGDLVFLLRGDAGWVVDLVGRYEDALRKVNGRWLFEKRILSSQ